MRTRIRTWRILQVLSGLMLLGICVVLVMLALTGKTIYDRDITPVFLIAPFGLYLVFTKKRIID